MEKISYTCDSCGAEAPKADHWFTVIREGCMLMIIPQMHVSPRVGRGDDKREVKHACSEECALKLIPTYLKAPHAAHPEDRPLETALVA
jgi:hypothetical protein